VVGTPVTERERTALSWKQYYDYFELLVVADGIAEAAIGMMMKVVGRLPPIPEQLRRRKKKIIEGDSRWSENPTSWTKDGGSWHRYQKHDDSYYDHP